MTTQTVKVSYLTARIAYHLRQGLDSFWAVVSAKNDRDRLILKAWERRVNATDIN